jgi:hypothetical protein
MAKTRNGTRIVVGSRPKPRRVRRPRPHTTATTEQAMGST